MVFYLNWDSCVYDGRKQGMQHGASGRLLRCVRMICIYIHLGYSVTRNRILFCYPTWTDVVYRLDWRGFLLELIFLRVRRAETGDATWNFRAFSGAVLRAIRCQRRHVRGSARARAHPVMFCDLKSPEVTAWAFVGGRVLGVGVYRGVRRPHFTYGLLFWMWELSIC